MLAFCPSFFPQPTLLSLKMFLLSLKRSDSGTELFAASGGICASGGRVTTCSLAWEAKYLSPLPAHNKAAVQGVGGRNRRKVQGVLTQTQHGVIPG